MLDFFLQPPSAPAIPSARCRLAGKKIETRSTNDLQLSEKLACPGFPKKFLKFYDRVYALVDDPATDSIISWGKSNKSFVIWNQEELIGRNMLLRFHCRTITEFISKLKHKGFKEIKGSSGGQLEFGNRRFVKGQPELLWLMHAIALDARMRKRM
ncbi:Heat stress transcription factor A-1 [Cardamine amara subsp. amara]|uniref:Heat stress transcription factor A-1 n=1 Tax=Cardamine amara subsp. amara TaxID=228776 RepID=A0ABD1C0W1_CARAN